MKMTLKNKEIILILSIVLIAFFNISCGYHLSGAGSSLPDDAKLIAIPDFDNPSSSPDAQQYITYAVRDEFIKRSKLKLTDDISKADLVLEGIIIKFTVTPLSYTERVSANLYRVSLYLDVKLIDTINDKVIYKNKSLRFSSTYDIDSSDFFSQEGKSLEKIAKEIASSIVTGILENF